MTTLRSLADLVQLRGRPLYPIAKELLLGLAASPGYHPDDQPYVVVIEPTDALATIVWADGCRFGEFP